MTASAPHRLVSRRPPCFRPSRPPCSLQSARSVGLLYVLDDKSAGRSAARRRGTLVAGAVAARLAGEPASAGCFAGVAQGTGAGGHRRAGARDRCRERVLERDRAIAASGRGRSGRRGARRDRCRRAPLPRRSAGRAEPDPQQGEPRPARVHAVLAAGAGAGRSAKAAAGAEEAERRAGPRQRCARRLETRADQARLGRRLARKLEARRSVGAGPPQGLPRGRRRRLCRRSRPARPRRHLTALAASSFRRDQPAPGLACRTLCRGRAPSPVRRHRQIPQRTRLARVLPSSAVRRPRSRDAQPAALLRRAFHGSTMPRRCARGSAAGPATRSSMPACANSGTPA